RKLALTLVEGFRYFDDQSNNTSVSQAAHDVPRSAVVLGALVWLVPGIVAMLLIFPVIRTLFRRAGVGGALLALGAREPRLGDLEEHQLVNVVEEMALAAGLPPPR